MNVGKLYPVRVLEQCNSIWVQNLYRQLVVILSVLEQCNSIWVQNIGRLTKDPQRF